MGLLDDLRNEASEQEAKDEQANNSKANTEEIYRTQTQPKLKELYAQLLELTKHLNYLKKEIHGKYIINAENQTVDLLQKDYIAHIDSTKETKLVTLAFKCVSPKHVEFSINDPKKVASNIQFLQQKQLQHQVAERRNDQGQLQGAKFAVNPSVTAKFAFQADIENASIKLTYLNFDQYGPISHNLKPEDVNDEFFDDLGRFILRENDNFLKVNVDDDVREQLRKKIEQENLERQEELKKAEELNEEEAKDSEENRFKLFKKMIKS